MILFPGTFFGRRLLFAPHLCRHSMRISILLLAATLTVGQLLQASPGYSQDADSIHVTIGLSNGSLREAFARIEKQTTLLFAYQPQQVAGFVKINLPRATRTLKATLDLLFKGTDLEYRVSGNNVIVYRPKKTGLSDPLSVQDLSALNMPLADTPVIIRGRVVDKDGHPIPGAGITLKRTNRETSTQENGEFIVRARNTETHLLVHCVGYQAREAALIAGKTYYVLTLESSTTTLKDMVVTGVIRRSNESFTGAVTTFTAEQLRTSGNQNTIASLKALDPSFQVFDNIQAGSNPNTLPNIQLRGASNLPDLKGDYTGNPNVPLFILDGFEVPLQKIFDLDMNRVEKVTILKDATGTALYGSRGANGVVVVNTKQPEPGKLRISYTGDLTLETPDLSAYHLLDGARKLQAEKAAGLYTSEDPARQQWMNERYNDRYKEIQRGVNTDWLAQPVRNSFGQRHYVYLDGGDAYLRYAVDLSANNSTGVMKGSARNTYTGGMMLSYRYKQLLFRNYLSYSANKGNNSPYGSFSDYAKMNPYWRVRDPSGNVLKVVDQINTRGLQDTFLVANPYYNGTINTKDNSGYQEMIDYFSLEWNISQSFKFRSNFNVTRQKNDQDVFLPADHTAFLNYSSQDFFRKGTYTQGNGNLNVYEMSSYLDFNRLMGRSLLYATVGYDLGEASQDQTVIVAEGFPNQFLDNPLYAAQYQQNGKPAGFESLTRHVTFLSNFNYSYDSRYVADLSVSTDGSSQFGTANKFAPFWSAGAGWNVHHEKWAQNLGAINYLKLRGSYGITGSQNFPAYQAMTTYEYFTNVRYLDGLGAYLLGLGNRDLKWQQKKTLNIGADVNLFNNRLSMTANYYHERTQDQLIDLTSAPSIGFSSYKENVGEVENNGYELNARLVLVRNDRRQLNWSINGSFFHNDNKLRHISNALKDYNDQQNGKQVTNGQTTPVQLYKEGQSMSAIFVVPSLGIDPATGKEVFRKQDGSSTFIWDPADKVVDGDINPKIRGIFGTNLMYKGLTFNALFSFYTGGQVYNQTLVDRVENADLRFNVDERVLEERWQKPGDRTFFKNIADNGITLPSSRFVQNDSRLMCESISLQYDFKNWAFLKTSGLKPPVIKTLRVSLYANEPFYFRSVREERGLQYPFAHTYSLSIQTSF